jgi:hypothetical protein
MEESRMMAELKSSGSGEEGNNKLIELKRRHLADLEKIIDSYGVGVDATATSLVTR